MNLISFGFDLKGNNGTFLTPHKIIPSQQQSPSLQNSKWNEEEEDIMKLISKKEVSQNNSADFLNSFGSMRLNNNLVKKANLFKNQQEFI